jgi:tetratricopeptide (TPR) repeat protein
MRSSAAAPLLTALVFLAYGNSLGNGFVFDDLPLIAHDRALGDLHRLPHLFLQDYWAGSRDDHEVAVAPRSGLYRPAVIASYALNVAVGGAQPWLFHLVNTVLHALATCLLYLVAREHGVTPVAALSAAVLFAVHPLHTEAVTAIIGRAELLMSLGVLAALWFAARRKPGLASLAYALALFSKEQALVLPLLLLISDWARDGQVLSGRWWLLARRRYAAYGLVLAGYLILRGVALGGFPLPPVDSLVNPAAVAAPAVRIWTAVKVAGLYLGLLVWPARLSANYSFDSIALVRSPLDPAVIVSVLMWICLPILAAWAYRQGKRPILFAVALLFLTFLPVSNLFFPIGTIMGERLFYLPSAGFCLLVGLAIEWVRRTTCDVPSIRGHATAAQNLRASHLARRTVFAGFLMLVCAALIVRTAIRNQDWQDNEHLALSMLRVVPRNAMAHALLGYVRKTQDTPETRAQAVEAYETALQIYPDYVRLDPLFASHYGQLLFQAGRQAEAVRTFEAAVTTHQRWSSVHYNLGLAYAGTGRMTEAEEELRRAQALNPADADTYNVLSHVLLQQGRALEALAAAEQALGYAPRHEGAQYYRALAQERLARP